MTNREDWLHGWARSGYTVMVGPKVHCAGCGAYLGIAALAVDDDDVAPDRDPEWPFAADDCPVCALRNRLYNEEDTRWMMEHDALRWQYLRGRFVAVDFDYGQEGITAAVFALPPTVTDFTVDIDSTVDRSMRAPG